MMWFITYSPPASYLMWKVTHYVSQLSQAIAHSAHWHRISYHLTYGLWTYRT